MTKEIEAALFYLQTYKCISLVGLSPTPSLWCHNFLTLLQLSAGKFKLHEHVKNEFSGKGGGGFLLTSDFHSSVEITANRNVRNISLNFISIVFKFCIIDNTTLCKNQML